MKANYHTHTWRCNHAEPDEREYVERAIEGGIKILGFSDHTPYPFSDSHYSNFRMGVHQLEDYVNTVLALKEEYKNDIEIHLGLETEYYPNYFDKLQDLIRPYPIEYMILGQHFIYDEIGAPYSGQHTYSKKNLKQYVNQVIEALNTGCFTYLAHPDLIHFKGLKKVYQEEMRRLCQEARRLNIPLEINFLGLYEYRNYPTKKFWEVVAQEGNDVIYGCDAHTIKSVYNPEMEAKAKKQYVDKLGLHLIEMCELKNPFR